MIALSYRQRLALLTLLGGCGLLLLVLRLFQLQVLEREQWQARARSQAAGWKRMRARRGRILDARGRPLAADEAGFDLVVYPAAWRGLLYECDHCGNRRYLRREEHEQLEGAPARCPRCRHDEPSLRLRDARDLRELARRLEMPSADLAGRVEALVRRVEENVVRELEGLTETKRERRRRMLWADLGWRGERVARDVPYEVAREVELHPHRNPAFRIETVHTRRYPGGEPFVHLLGRVRSDLVLRRDPDYAKRWVPFDEGVSRLELAFEQQLRGETGWVRIVRDPRERTREVSDAADPAHGADLQLTLDAEVQARALLALHGVEGALVVIDAESGAVLALASAPSYAPEDYARTLSVWTAREKAYGSDGTAGTPLIDRACRHFHIPGSIYKPFTAVAALRAAVCTPETRVDCDGTLRRDDGTPYERHKCHDRHGVVDLHGALVHSCNIYFQTLARGMIAADRFDLFEETGRRFGFGLATGIEIERDPQPDTFQLAESWGIRVLSSIGQGKLELSPAQVARAYAGLATGFLPRLHVVSAIGGRPIAVERTPLGIPESCLRPVRAALFDVPRSGTARGHSLERFGLACKTGTAQTGRRELHNSWIAGYGPARAGRPPIAFALVVLDTREATAAVCGPRLEEFFRFFFQEARE